MPDAILHIGFNKCGSTALQSWLGDNIDALAEHGLRYRRMDPRPDVVCTHLYLRVLALSMAGLPVPPRPMNAVLGIEAGDRTSEDRVAAAFRSEFEAQVRQGAIDTWIGSSEALVSRDMTPRSIAALADWLSGLFNPVRYIVYVRRPETWLVSAYGHYQRKSQSVESLTDFVTRVRQAPYARLLRMWEAVVGRNALDVRLFREQWLTGTGLIDDFLTVLRLPPKRVVTEARILNTSFRRGRLSLSRAPTRPRLTAATHEFVKQANAEDMAWIERTFFADRRAEFQAWAAGQEAGS